MERQLRMVLCGAGGYGRHYLDAMLHNRQVKLVGMVQTNMHRHQDLAEQMAALGVPVGSDLTEMLRAHLADAVVVTTPIQFHDEQCTAALKAGCHVLCEKPLTSDYARAMALERLAHDEAVQLQLGVGYQQSWSPAMLQLKQDLISGRYGKPVRAASISLMPRPRSYFTRNGWAGRIADDQGRMVLDSVLHNGAAHQLHAMLYLLGREEDAAAQVMGVAAECIRAHDVETYDTCAVRIATRECDDVLYAATHACDGDVAKRVRMEWEKGWLDVDFARDDALIMHTPSGEVPYGSCQMDIPDKLDAFVTRILRNEPLPCSACAAKAEVAVTVGCSLSADVLTVPAQEVEKPEGIYLHIPGLEETLKQSFDTGKLPCEFGAPLGNMPRFVGAAEIIRAGF